MKKYYLDFTLSKKIYNSNKNVLEINKCYNNIFNITTCRDLVSKDIRVAYGFIYRSDLNMFTRHCFILLNNKAIDPTVLFWNTKNVQDIVTYYPFKIYHMREYISTLAENNRWTDLYEGLLEEEIQAHNRLIDMNFERNILEESEFLQRVYKKNFWKGVDDYNKNNKKVIK